MSIADDEQIARDRGWTELHIRESPQLFFPRQVDRALWGIPPGAVEHARVPFFSMEDTMRQLAKDIASEMAAKRTTL